MGAGTASRVAKLREEVSSVILIGFPVVTDAPLPNVLYAIGKFEEIFNPQTARREFGDLLGIPKENVEVTGTPYGNFSEKTAKGFLLASSDHLFEVLDPHILSTSVTWLWQSFSESGEATEGWKVPFEAVVSFLAGLSWVSGLLFGLYVFKSSPSSALPWEEIDSRPPVKSQFSAKDVRNGIVHGLLHGVLSFVAFLLGFPLSYVFPLSFGGLFLGWFLFGGVFYVFRLWRFRKTSTPSNFEMFTVTPSGVEKGSQVQKEEEETSSCLTDLFQVIKFPSPRLWEWKALMWTAVLLGFLFVSLQLLFAFQPYDFRVVFPLFAPLYHFRFLVFLVFWLAGTFFFLYEIECHGPSALSPFLQFLRNFGHRFWPFALVLLVLFLPILIQQEPLIGGTIGFGVLFLVAMIPLFLLLTAIQVLLQHLEYHPIVPALISGFLVAWQLSAVLPYQKPF